MQVGPDQEIRISVGDADGADDVEVRRCYTVERMGVWSESEHGWL